MTITKMKVLKAGLYVLFSNKDMNLTITFLKDKEDGEITQNVHETVSTVAYNLKDLEVIDIALIEGLNDFLTEINEICNEEFVNEAIKSFML
ncbi:MAG: hypothetical protein ACRCX2_24190 [Paraclostridium sp.]